MPVLIKCGGAPGGIPAEIMPQITCSSPHLRDIIYRGGKAYLRVGFFGSCTFTVSGSVTVRIEAIGPGGDGGHGTATYFNGGGGFCGYRYSGSKTIAGVYQVDISKSHTKLTKDGVEIVLTNPGPNGKDGEWMSSSDSNGEDGYTDNMPHKLAEDGQGGTSGFGGFGYGAGGGGGTSTDDDGYPGGAGALGCIVLLMEV